MYEGFGAPSPSTQYNVIATYRLKHFASIWGSLLILSCVHTINGPQDFARSWVIYSWFIDSCPSPPLPYSLGYEYFMWTDVTLSCCTNYLLNKHCIVFHALGTNLATLQYFFPIAVINHKQWNHSTVKEERKGELERDMIRESFGLPAVMYTQHCNPNCIQNALFAGFIFWYYIDPINAVG